MKKYIVLVAVFLLTLILTAPSRAALQDRGSGLIYDDILDITWMEHANYSGETMTWSDAMNWADSFVFQGYNDWRLPTSDISCTGYDCTGSEMGHLYYNYDITYDSPDIFTDVRSYMYWSADENTADTSKAWRFHFGSGYQGTSSKTYKRYALAVRDGDSAPPVVPEPAAYILFIAGGISLAAGRFRKRQGITGPDIP